MTVKNGQKIRCKLNGTVSMKLQGGETAKLNEVLHVLQSVNNLLSISRLVSKGVIMGATKSKLPIKKNGVNMIMDARKGKNEITIFYLKDKIYAPEVSSNQE